MQIKLYSLIMVLLLGWSLNGFAQKLTDSAEFKNEFGFISDNDAYLLYGQDRYYTNGLMIYFRRATDQRKLNHKLEKITYEISAGQKMFNPRSGYRPLQKLHDRPFAGYLFAGASANLFYKKERILKTALELGTVGPNALGEDAQKLLHKVVGFYEIDGWQYQIKNELAANLNLAYTQLLHRSAHQKLDFSISGYANIGTTFTGAGVGVVMRSGEINQLFQTAYTQSAMANHAKTPKLVVQESFFYIKPQLNYVAYDATIQGSLFNSDSPVTFKTKPLVFTQQLGYNYSSKRFTFDFALMFKSKEVKSTAKAHQYGSISMFYRFN